MNQCNEQKQAFNQWWDEQDDDDIPKLLAWKAWHQAWSRTQYAQPPAPPSAWISVRERLPVNTDLVLTFDGHVRIACFKVDNWFAHGVYVYKVTHWQPLPAPPAPADPFDAWWESLPVAETDTGTRNVRKTEWGVVLKDTARCIWKSALASHATP